MDQQLVQRDDPRDVAGEIHPADAGHPVPCVGVVPCLGEHRPGIGRFVRIAVLFEEAIEKIATIGRREPRDVRTKGEERGGGKFTATGEMQVRPGQNVVPKDGVHYEMWNRLISEEKS